MHTICQSKMVDAHEGKQVNEEEEYSYQGHSEPDPNEELDEAETLWLRDLENMINVVNLSCVFTELLLETLDEMEEELKSYRLCGQQVVVRN